MVQVSDGREQQRMGWCIIRRLLRYLCKVSTCGIKLCMCHWCSLNGPDVFIDFSDSCMNSRAIMVYYDCV